VPVPSSSMYVKLTLVPPSGSLKFLFFTPGEQQTASIISLLVVMIVGHVFPWQFEYVPTGGGGGGGRIRVGLKPGVGVTTAVLAPCLAAFLSEFFVYQARANSVMPKRIRSNKKRMIAVSINV
jgi:hypothetical protein